MELLAENCSLQLYRLSVLQLLLVRKFKILPPAFLFCAPEGNRYLNIYAV